MKPFSKRRTRLLLAVAAVGAALIGGPVVEAHASPEQDQSLYDVMYDEGVVLFPAAYSQARRACGLMWQGYSPDSMVVTFRQINPGWTTRQATMFVAYSIAIYCPPADTSAPAPINTPRSTTV